nr:DnaJ domain-containing protein [uncultured Desulfuromonas sp.]
MSLFAETELLEACRVLFGSDLQLNRDFLFYIQPSGVKTAYRQRAKETHPDRLVDAEPHEYEQQTELFRGVSEAYQLLQSFTADPIKRLWRPADQQAGFDAPSRPSAWRQPAAEPDTADGIYELPRRHLELGLYLYYRGIISYSEMIEALVWQRRQRPVLGDLAERWGWLSAADVKRINSYHGRRGRFGARAVELGYLTQFQVQVLLRYQRQLQKRYGQYFVEQGRMTNADIEAWLREQQYHNQHFEDPWKKWR